MRRGCTCAISVLARRKSGPPSSFGVVLPSVSDISLGQSCQIWSVRVWREYFSAILKSCDCFLFGNFVLENFGNFLGVVFAPSPPGWRNFGLPLVSDCRYSRSLLRRLRGHFGFSVFHPPKCLLVSNPPCRIFSVFH